MKLVQYHMRRIHPSLPTIDLNWLGVNHPIHEVLRPLTAKVQNKLVLTTLLCAKQHLHVVIVIESDKAATRSCKGTGTQNMNTGFTVSEI